MNIQVAGRDRTADLGPDIAAEAAQLKATRSIAALAPEHSAQVLKNAADGDDYLHRFVGLLRLRHGVRTAEYYIPRRPGWQGRISLAVKTLLWKLLRYQHDRTAFQQNLINELNSQALERQNAVLTQEIERLRRRVEQFEKTGSK